MSFDALLKLVPDYIDQFLRLVGGARRFFAGQELNDKKALVRALLFLLNSSILAFVLRVPVLEGETVYWQTAAVTVVFYMATAVALGAVAFGCCRLVGGKAPLPGHITIFAYVAGISTIVFALATLIAGGIIQVNLPDQATLYGEYMSLLMSGGDGLEASRFDALNDSRELTFAILVILAGTPGDPGLGDLVLAGLRRPERDHRLAAGRGPGPVPAGWLRRQHGPGPGAVRARHRVVLTCSAHAFT